MIQAIARIATKKKSLVFVGGITALAAGMALYYVFMPAWIIVIREGEDENALPSIESRVKITEDDLAQLPKLKDAIAKADGNYPYMQWQPPIKAWYWEGTQLIERFDMDSQYPPEYRAFMTYEYGNDEKKVYLIQVIFTYEHPGQM